MKLSVLKFGRYPPAVVAKLSTPIIEVLRNLKIKGVRHSPIVSNEGKLVGMVSARDLINFLGGGPKHRIVTEKYGGDIYSALNKEPVSSIMYQPPYVTLDHTLQDVVNLMMERDIGALPVLDEDGKVSGIISEKHIMNLFTDVKTYVCVEEIMSSPVITLPPQAYLIEGQELMLEKDIRRLVLVENSSVKGLVTLKDMVRFYSNDETLGKLKLGLAKEVHKTPLANIASSNVVTADAKMDVGDAIKRMRIHKIGCLPVMEGKKLVGIVTERDILLKLPKIKGVEVFVDMAEKLITAGRIFL